MARIPREFNCLFCGKLWSTEGNRKIKYCSNQCSVDHKRQTLIENWKKGIESGIKLGCRIKTAIRLYLFEKFDNKCCKCGWNKLNPYSKSKLPPLEINHIDGNSLNNKEENLELICPNCHALTSTWRALNKGNANKERLIYSRLIKE